MSTPLNFSKASNPDKDAENVGRAAQNRKIGILNQILYQEFLKIAHIAIELRETLRGFVQKGFLFYRGILKTGGR